MQSNTPEIISRPSPNFNRRPDDEPISVLVLHYTGMKTAAEAIDRLCDPDAEVSSHYFIDEDGAVSQLVEEEKRAWHAGISCWRGRSSINDISIGIELVNPGHEHGYREFPDAQMQSLIGLSKDIMDRYGIEPRNVVGHSDIAPTRKQDPGELFDWKGLAWEGVGLWPEVQRVKKRTDMIIRPGEESKQVEHIQSMLAEYGYHIKSDGFYGPKTEKVIYAFRAHFVPQYVNVIWDGLADTKMRRLLELI